MAAKAQGNSRPRTSVTTATLFQSPDEHCRYNGLTFGRS